MKTFRVMFLTELKLAIRGMDMIIFAIALPIVEIIILGIIYGNKPAFQGANYTFLAQSFGAVITIAISASGLMGLPLVVSDYRNKKILKGFIVTPVSPLLILFVQIIVNMLISVTSLILVYLVVISLYKKMELFFYLVFSLY